MQSIYIKTTVGDIAISFGSHPEKCPYCHVFIHPKILVAYLRDINSTSVLDAALKCANSKCQRTFVATYQQFYSPFGNNTCYEFSELPLPEAVEVTSFTTSIKALSAYFVEIYNQSERAEATALDKVAGVGYRKALEFLVKDYLIYKIPSNEDSIKKTMLGPCIKQIDDTKIKNIAERATWLGNDETHYVRKWIEKDVNDLKALIKLVVHYIDADLLYEETIKSMQ